MVDPSVRTMARAASYARAMAGVPWVVEFIALIVATVTVYPVTNFWIAALCFVVGGAVASVIARSLLRFPLAYLIIGRKGLRELSSYASDVG